MTQLDVLPQNTTGLPTTLDYHPFRFIDFKEQARIRKQAAQCSAVQAHERQRRFYMDFGFMRASALDYSRRDKAKDRVVFSYDGYSSYLLIVDEASRYIWVFLTASKSPPLDIVKEFLNQQGHEDGGCVRTDQGGELARSSAFQDMLLRDFHYTLEPTGADSPSQNGAVEIYNDKFGVRTRTLSTAPVSLLNSGQRPSSILSTFTIGWSIAKPKSLLSNVTMAVNILRFASSMYLEVHTTGKA